VRVRELGRPIVGKVIGLVAVISVLLGARWIAFSVQDIGTVSTSARSVGDDGLWLSHLWVDGRKGPADVTALATELHGTGIKDLFVHSGPLSDDGSLNPALLPKAKWFVGAVHQQMPGVRVQAWLGQEITPEGKMDLESAATRARIVESVRYVLADGYDGIHLDFEPVGDADPGYLTLLDQLRPIVHAAGGLLSVSAEQVEPVPGSRWAMEAVAGHGTWWSAAYLHQVAIRVDEVAVMAYNTALWSPSSYAGFVRDETAVALAAVPPDVALLIGVPAYHNANNLTHLESAETVGAAIRGVRLALPGGTPSGRAFGVALYMDYYATPADWEAYRSDWVSP
jgi:hypothetical protein